MFSFLKNCASTPDTSPVVAQLTEDAIVADQELK
jgi:hypothetical protein